MCDCITSWDAAVWRAAAKIARTRPDTVFAVYSALEGDGDRAGRLRPEILAAGLGRRTHVVERIIASLASLGVTCDGVVTAEWRRERPALERSGLSMKPSAVRMRQKRARDRLVEGPPVTAPQSPPAAVTCDAVDPLLSLFPADPAQQEQKQTRGRVEQGDDGFGALRALWPITNRMTEAERDYRRYRQKHDAGAIIAAARQYLATKPEWQSCLFLLNWLRTDPCREQPLRLAMAPVEVPGSAPRPPRPDWIARKAQLSETGIWPPEWGPRWGEPGCLVPPDTGVAYSIAAWFAKQQQEQRAG